MSFRLTDTHIAAFRRDGAVCLPQAVSAHWVERLANGVEHNLAHPGDMAQNYTDAAGNGAYFGDYCNWRRIPDFAAFVFKSAMAEHAAELMSAASAQFFHEHVLVKAPGTQEATPWHHDQPYYVVDGDQVVSFWVALDPVAQSVCPRFVAGSHRWGRLFYPRRFKDGADYDYAGEGYESVPDIDAAPNEYRLLSWALEPGDAVAFHFKTVHDAPANRAQTRRRAIAFRWLGDDTCYAQRPGTPSPPYPDMGIDQQPGERLREDWFPTIWPPHQHKDVRKH